jgi:uncharacterized protein (TIGR00290 family)
MTSKIPAIISWSGGKDCAYALYKILKEDVYEVKYLLSTFNGNKNRLSMHGVQEVLIEEQARQLEIPLLKVYVFGSSNEEYETVLDKALSIIKEEGIRHLILGDIFLEDLRIYREEKMKAIGITCIFPLWRMDTHLLLKDFLAKGFKTITCCIHEAYITKDWVGREINAAFINELPHTVDPCGENGEYHSFCFDGPIFKEPIKVEKGNITYQFLELNAIPTMADDKSTSITKGFWYIELELATNRNNPAFKACARCGQSFECKVADIIHCHCYGMKLNDISIKYDDCLCHLCLLELNK